MTYEQIDSKLDLPALDRKVLQFWKDNSIYEKRVESQSGKPRWTFIDGPITANNPMGVHHAWGRTYKDLWARFKFMRGYQVRNQNGFDCQGLWVEVEVEKELGFKSKRDIEAYGIPEFVIKCKQRVMNYSAIQTEQSIRLGMWTDWNRPEELRKLAKALETPLEEIVYEGTQGPVLGTAEYLVGQLGSRKMGGSYYTLSDENNYMIWTVLKSCHERGWIYKGADAMPWCPRCSTGISQHEIVTEGYKELTHTSVYVKYPLREHEGSLLIWTTTPWTLTSNVAVAVHPELDYVKIKFKGDILYLSKGTVSSALQKKEYELLEEFKGADLEGWTYNGPFDDLELPREMGAHEAHRVIFWKEVGEDEGTGMVHIAPGAGKEDLELGKLYGLPIVAPLDEYGVFIDGLGWLSGTHVYDSPETIFEKLHEKGILFRTQRYKHRYPVCWRCGSELVFRHVSEWFINMGEKLDKPREEVTEAEKVKSLRYQIMDSAIETRWIPGFGEKQELDWLSNMDDWMISKKRYWGLALPIWQCECGWFDVIGSKEELKERAVEGWDEFDGHSPHKPYIDLVKIQCPECGKNVSRIPDVGNPWLDAGIVAYSTLDYRTDKDYWNKWFPAEFITECYIGQFRNWFYSMLAMSTILERRTPFKVCLGHGTVLAEDGRQMHKSWGNAIWFDDAAETMGADVMRWMFSSNIPEKDILFGYNKAGEVKRFFFMPVLNIYNFFAMYAKLDKWAPDQQPEKLAELDRWVLSRLNQLVKVVTDSLDSFNALTATHEIEKFVDELSTWYVRRSRRRFWKSEANDDKKAAYSTLYTCLKTLTHLIAPFIPFLSEEIYQKLVRSVEKESEESLHLSSWPVVNVSLIDEDLMAKMDLAIKACSIGRAARNNSSVKKLRQPMQEALFLANNTMKQKLEALSVLIMEELNVKQVRFTSEASELQSYKLKPVRSLLGRKHGRNLMKVVQVIETLGKQEITMLVNGENVMVNVDGSPVEILAEEVHAESLPVEGYSVISEGGLTVGIKTKITEELAREGLARDIVRRIQDLRKLADFNIDDKIETWYSGDEKILDVFKTEREYITSETLTQTLTHGDPPSNAKTQELDIDGQKVKLGVRKI